MKNQVNMTPQKETNKAQITDPKETHLLTVRQKILNNSLKEV